MQPLTPKGFRFSRKSFLSVRYAKKSAAEATKFRMMKVSERAKKADFDAAPYF